MNGSDSKLDIPGIRILSSRDNGTGIVCEFSIDVNATAAAIDGLLESLRTFDEFSLCDHRRGDLESATIFRLREDQTEAMTGGHGWSGDWRYMDHAAAAMEIGQLVQYNHGPPRSDCGHLVKHHGR